MKLASMARGALDRAGYIASFFTGRAKKDAKELDRMVELCRAMQELETTDGWRRIAEYLQERKRSMIQGAQAENILQVRERLDEIAKLELFVRGSISNGLWAMEQMGSAEGNDDGR